VEIIEPQVIADGTTKKTKYCLRFQKSWYKQYRWIHYDETIKGVLCFTCIQAESLRLSDLSRKTEPTFIKNGFRNWKKAQERFLQHHRSASHRFAEEQLGLHVAASKHPTINAQLCQQKKAEQTVACKCMHAIMSTAKFLARQGLPFWGHSHDDGSFKQLLLLRVRIFPS